MTAEYSHIAMMNRIVLLLISIHLASCAPNSAYHGMENQPVVRPLGLGFYVILDSKSSNRILKEALGKSGNDHQRFIEEERLLVTAEVERLFTYMHLCPAGFVVIRLTRIDKSPNYEITTACK